MAPSRKIFKRHCAAAPEETVIGGYFEGWCGNILRVLYATMQQSCCRCDIVHLAASCIFLLRLTEGVCKEMCSSGEDRRAPRYEARSPWLSTWLNLQPTESERRTYGVRCVTLDAKYASGSGYMDCDHECRAVAWGTWSRNDSGMTVNASRINIHAPSATDSRRYGLDIWHGQIIKVCWMKQGTLLVWQAGSLEVLVGDGSYTTKICGKMERKQWWKEVWRWDGTRQDGPDMVVSGVYCQGGVVLVQTEKHGDWLVAKNEKTGHYERVQCDPEGCGNAKKVVIVAVPCAGNAPAGLVLIAPCEGPVRAYEFMLNKETGSYSVRGSETKLGKAACVETFAVTKDGSSAYLAVYPGVEEFSGARRVSIPQLKVMRVRMRESQASDGYVVSYEDSSMEFGACCDLQLFPDGDTRMWIVARNMKGGGFFHEDVMYLSWKDLVENRNTLDKCCRVECSQQFCASVTEHGVLWGVRNNGEVQRYAYRDGVIHTSELHRRDDQLFWNDEKIVRVAHMNDGTLLVCQKNGALSRVF